MVYEFQDLNSKFLSIKSCGWIRSMRNDTSGVGYTFEALIGKHEENFPIPDYKNVEIKTSRKNSWGKIHLFHLTPDGDFLFPIKEILDVLGYPDKDIPNCNVFNYNLNAKKYTTIKNGKQGKIYVDRKNRKLSLLVKDAQNNKLDINVSWSFYALRERLNLKLKCLALVKAVAKKCDGNEYFKYNEIAYYKLKEFNTFIDLIEQGTISLTFMIGVHKKGNRFGQIHDRGTTFTIREKDITFLYDRVYI